jgi:hypothetical protein
MSNSQGNDGAQSGGCVALFVLALIVGAIVAALISLAALVDPFNWMPRVGEIWADCEADCALAHRFPGFWWHAAANLVYAAAAATAACCFIVAVVELREKRVGRYGSSATAAAYSTARGECVGCGVVLGALALLPIVVVIA